MSQELKINAFFKAICCPLGPLGPGDCFTKALIFMDVGPETVSLLFYNIKSAIFTSNMECLT